MEIVIKNDIISIQTFLSGSEANLLAYEFKWKEDEKNPNSLCLSKNYSNAAPVMVLVESIKKKLKRTLEGQGLELSDVTGLDCIYDVHNEELSNLLNKEAKLVCLIPLSRAIQVDGERINSELTNVGEAKLWPGGWSAEFVLDNITEPSPFIVAHLN